MTRMRCPFLGGCRRKRIVGDGQASCHQVYLLFFNLKLLKVLCQPLLGTQASHKCIRGSRNCPFGSSGAVEDMSLNTLVPCRFKVGFELP